MLWSFIFGYKLFDVEGCYIFLVSRYNYSIYLIMQAFDCEREKMLLVNNQIKLSSFY